MMKKVCRELFTDTRGGGVAIVLIALGIASLFGAGMYYEREATHRSGTYLVQNAPPNYNPRHAFEPPPEAQRPPAGAPAADPNARRIPQVPKVQSGSPGAEPRVPTGVPAPPTAQQQHQTLGQVRDLLQAHNMWSPDVEYTVAQNPQLFGNPRALVLLESILRSDADLAAKLQAAEKASQDLLQYQANPSWVPGWNQFRQWQLGEYETQAWAAYQNRFIERMIEAQTQLGQFDRFCRLYPTSPECGQARR